MVNEPSTSTNNTETYHSDKNAILQALESAIQDVMRYEGKLLEIKCSERAIVHWLANYFMKHIAETDFIKSHDRFLLKRDDNESTRSTDDFQLGYTVDVEYNRVGAAGESKKICHDCSKCIHTKKCAQKDEEEQLAKDMRQPRNAMLDMIFHQRRRNNEASNVFCLEVKTTSTPQDDYRTYCDYNRIHDLVVKDSKINPQYQFGAAVHIYDVNEATIYFFTRDKTEPAEINVTLQL